MTDSSQIRKAIAAHSLWKQRLQTAIKTGQSEFLPARVRLDNQCDFGKWFYNLPPADQSSIHGQTIQPLHADFHIEAGRILDLALKGEKDQAAKAIGLASKFALISADLTAALLAWWETLGEEQV